MEAELVELSAVGFAVCITVFASLSAWAGLHIHALAVLNTRSSIPISIKFHL